MNVLIIEDDDLKFELLVNFLREEVRSIAFVRAASYQAGVTKLATKSFDLVLLDMTLPVSDLEHSPVGMEWLTFGGQLVLRECKRRRVGARIVIVSQYKAFIRDNVEVSFEQLKEEILREYEQLVIGFVHLDRAADDWKKGIANIIAL